MDNNINNVMDITTLIKEYKEKSNLEAYATQLYNSFTSLLKEKQQLLDKIKHLEDLTISLSVNKVDFVVNPEVAFIETQINRLRITYKDSDITDDDCKKLESLMRSLKIARDKNPPIKVNNKSNLPMEEAELILLAASKIEDVGR